MARNQVALKEGSPLTQERELKSKTGSRPAERTAAR